VVAGADRLPEQDHGAGKAVAGEGTGKVPTIAGMVRTLAAAVLLVAVAACGGPAAHSASPVPSPSHSSAPSTTLTAPASSTPDNETVEKVASGFGAFDLEVFPVAVLHNQASAHTATLVVVSFTVHFPGGTYSLAAEPVSLAPEETLAVTALCTDSCEGATNTDVFVAVGGWEAGDRTVISATSATYTCGSPCAGTTGYQGDVAATLSGQVSSRTQVSVSAACEDGAGDIVGGGLLETVWPGGSSKAESVPVLVSAPPASCQLYATEIS
jgi:hypothetical protein